MLLPADPPGGIGLFADADTVVLLPLAEPSTNVLPTDIAGGLADLTGDAAAGLPIAPVTAAFTGPGRKLGGSDVGLVGQDIADATLLRRDLTVQALLSWDVGAQALRGTPGVLAARGPENQLVWAVQLEPVGPWRGAVRMLWHDALGNAAVPSRAAFPVPRGFVLLTVVRRWRSDTHVEVFYYIDEQRIGSAVSPLGRIAGAAVAPVTIGCVASSAGYRRFCVGVLDQLKVTRHAMTAEEVRQTYRRIALHQPAGYAMVHTLVPVGEVYSGDPHSAIQRELMVEGDALGLALGSAEELHEDYSPERAWSLLGDWERIARLPPRGDDTIEARRQRVLSYLRKVHGYSPPQIRDALAPALDADPSEIDILEYTNLYEETFSAGLAPWWSLVPRGGSIGIDAQRLAIELPSGADSRWEELSTPLARIPIDGDVFDADPARAADLTVRLAEHSLPLWTLGGLFFASGTTNDATFFGLVTVGSLHHLVALTYRDNAWQVGVVVALNVPASLWLRARYDGGGRYTLFHSDVGPNDDSHPSAFQGSPNPSWCGIALLSLLPPTIAGAARFLVDEVRAWVPNGLRVFNWYAHRDPSIAGTPDYAGAQRSVEKLAPAYTEAAAVGTAALTCDDALSMCDDAPMGG